MKLKFISKLLIFSVLASSLSTSSFANSWSEDGRYETFEGENITIDNILEEDTADVEIEGNTLINLLGSQGKGIYYMNNSNINQIKIFNDINLKANSVYTFIANINNTSGSKTSALKVRYTSTDSNNNIEYIYPDGHFSKKNIADGKSLIVFSTNNYIPDQAIEIYVDLIGNINGGTETEFSFEMSECILVEGDYSNKDISYFEGLKSVGEKEDGTASLGIKSLPGNDNLIANSDFKVTATKDKAAEIKTLRLSSDVKLQSLVGKDLTLSFDVHAPGPSKNNPDYPLFGETYSRFGIHMIARWENNDGSGQYVDTYPLVLTDTINVSHKRVSISQKLTSPNGYDKLISFVFAFQTYRMPADDNNETWYLARPKLELGKEATPWIPNYNEDSYSYYVKKIELSEPLRSLPDGTKDRIIKKNRQWVVERKIAEVVLDGSNDESWWDNFTNHEYCTTKRYLSTNIINNGSTDNSYAGQDVIISSKYPWSKAWSNSEKFGISRTGNSIFLYDINLANVSELVNSLSNNPIKILYKTNNTVYEPLNVDLSVKIFEKTTCIANDSIITANMKVVVDRAANRAAEAVELAKATPTVENLAQARYWANLLKESTLKDSFQEQVDDIIEVEDLTIERKTASVNADVYIKMKNTLSLSLDTNSIIFDEVDTTEDTEMQKAVNLTVSSSLPYKINAYLEDELYNSDKTETLDKSILNIRANGKPTYQAFTDLSTPIILLDDQESGVDTIHGIDLKLASNDTHKADIYKTSIKFEVIQK